MLETPGEELGSLDVGENRFSPEKPTALNAKFRLNASTTERSTLRLQLSCSRSCEGEEIGWAKKPKAVDFSYGLSLATKCISSMLTAVGAARGVQMD